MTLIYINWQIYSLKLTYAFVVISDRSHSIVVKGYASRSNDAVFES